MAKVYCTHGPSAFFVLEPKALDGKTVWVAGECAVKGEQSCRKPAYEYWQMQIKRCQNCCDPFCSPWEIDCKSCSESKPYKSWKWAARQRPPWEARP